jgi:hypothetical protein
MQQDKMVSEQQRCRINSQQLQTCTDTAADGPQGIVAKVNQSANTNFIKDYKSEISKNATQDERPLIPKIR